MSRPGVAAFVVISLVRVAGADLAVPRVEVTRVEFVTHPGMEPIPYLIVRATLREPAACRGALRARLGAEEVPVTPTADGFSGNLSPPKGGFVEGARLRVGCGRAPLRDTGFAFHREQLRYEGW